MTDPLTAVRETEKSVMKWYEFDVDNETPLEARSRRLMQMPTLSGAEYDSLYACRQACWDGNLPSKSGRDSLVARGLVVRWNGWQIASQEGLALLVEMGKLRS